MRYCKHVRGDDPQPFLAPGDPPARELSGAGPGEKPDAREPLRVAAGQDRGAAHRAAGRAGRRPPARGLHDPADPPPRPRGGGPGHAGAGGGADGLYAALAGLPPRQARIEAPLAQRHLAEGTLVLYDVTATYFEGRT